MKTDSLNGLFTSEKRIEHNAKEDGGGGRDGMDRKERSTMNGSN